MKALVVGGNGFIGSHLVDGLLEGGWQVLVYDRRPRPYDDFPARAGFVQGEFEDRDRLREAVAGTDVVFHLSWSSIHEVANQDPAADVSGNVLPSINLIDLCRHAGVKRMVFASSGGTVYGIPHQLPVSEDHPQNPLTAYGISKLAVEKYLQLFNHLHGLDYAIFRPSVPYGPRQNPLARQGAVAVFMHRVGNGLPITIWGDGSISRDYFFVTDLVDALIAGARKDLGSDRIFNIGGTEEISLLRLVELVEEVTGKKAKVHLNPARNFDVPRVWLDTRVARHRLDWTPKVSMQDGLARTWDWMNHADLSRNAG